MEILKEKMPEPMEKELVSLGKVRIRRIITTEDVAHLSIMAISKILLDALKRYLVEELLCACFKDFSSDKLIKLIADVKRAKINDKANCAIIFKELEKRFKEE